MFDFSEFFMISDKSEATFPFLARPKSLAVPTPAALAHSCVSLFLFQSSWMGLQKTARVV